MKQTRRRRRLKMMGLIFAFWDSRFLWAMVVELSSRELDLWVQSSGKCLGWVTQRERWNAREYDVSEKPSTECKIITDARGTASNGAYHFPARSDWACGCRHSSELPCLGCSMRAIPPAFSSSACPSAMTLIPLSSLLFRSSWETPSTALPPHLHLQPRHFPELWTHKSSYKNAFSSKVNTTHLKS